MPSVKIKNQTVCVDQKVIPLISGEVHYWRHNPVLWPEILRRVKQLGLSVISTYVPWGYHEYDRNHFDFTGRTDPQRNLLGFLELTRQEGFWLLIRPGPYIYSEWPYDGVPEYTRAYHKLHPQFLSWAFDYMRAVSEVIKPYQATRKGGHILMLQADNEIDLWPDLYGAQYGFAGTPGLFQDFIRSKYGGNIRRLNRAWSTTYRNFDQAGPFVSRMVDVDFDAPRGYPLKGDPELKRNLDYFQFKHFYALTYARRIVGDYRKLGIDVPIYLNVYPFFYAHDWRELQTVADVVALDSYAHNEFAQDETDHRKTLDKFRFFSRVSKAAFIAEFGCGVWHPQHYESGVMTPNHYRLTTISAIMSGITGWNWYMLVNRDNWYMSPINEWGRPREELYSVFQNLVSAYHAMCPPACERLTRIGATYNTLQYAAKTVPSRGTALTALYDADVDYRLFDPLHDQPDTPVLFYSGNTWLDRRAHRGLRRYVERGGVLVAFQDWPRKDEHFKPVSIVGFEQATRSLFEFKKRFTIKLGGESIALVNSVLTFDRVRAEPIQAEFDAGYGVLNVGYIKRIGRGRLIHLGVEPTPALIYALLRYLNVPLMSVARTPGVRTALFRKGSKFYLAVVHSGSEDKSAQISIPCLAGSKRKYRIKNLLSGKIASLTGGEAPVLVIPVARKDGYLFEIS